MKKNMKIIITGSAGFIGYHVAKRLLEKTIITSDLFLISVRDVAM